MSVSLVLLKMKANGQFIAGDCTMPGFEGCMTLSSISWDAEAKTEEKIANQPRTTMTPKPLRFEKTYDRASTVLSNLLNANTPIDSAVFMFVDSTTAKFDEILAIELTKALLVSISIRAAPSGKSIALTESVELSFEQIKLTYKVYDSKKQSRQAAFTFQTSQPPAGDEE